MVDFLKADTHSLFGGKRTTLQYKLEDETFELMKVDVTRVADHTMTAQATQHEVEDGADLSDHVIKKGSMFKMDGIISDNPISLAAATVGALAGVTSNIAGGVGGAIATGAVAKIGSTLLASGSGKPSKTAMEALEFVYEDSIPVIIISGLKTYTNMIMESLVAKESVTEGEALIFSASFRQINIAESEVVQIPVASTKVKGSIPKRKLGSKPAGAVAEGSKTASKGSSLLSKLVF